MKFTRINRIGERRDSFLKKFIAWMERVSETLDSVLPHQAPVLIPVKVKPSSR